MRALLNAAGADDDRLLIDDQSVDTLQSAMACARMLRTRADLEPVFVCSSPYHNPRCWTLLRILGIPARIAPMPSDRHALGIPKWLFYWVRECVALPWDALLALLARRNFLRDATGPKRDNSRES